MIVSCPCPFHLKVDIAKSTNPSLYASHITFLLAQVRQQDQASDNTVKTASASSRILATLVLIRLLGVLDESRFLALADQVVEAVSLPQVPANGTDEEQLSVSLTTGLKVRMTARPAWFPRPIL